MNRPVSDSFNEIPKSGRSNYAKIVYQRLKYANLTLDLDQKVDISGVDTNTYATLAEPDANKSLKLSVSNIQFGRVFERLAQIDLAKRGLMIDKARQRYNRKLSRLRSSRLGLVVLMPISKKTRSLGKVMIDKAGQDQRRSVGFGLLGVLLVLIVIIGLTADRQNVTASSYKLTVAEQALIGQPDKDLSSQFAFDSKSQAYYLNKTAINSTGASSSVPGNNVTVGGGSQSQARFSLEIPTDPKFGITTYDDTSKLSFTMIPEFSMSSAKEVSGHTVYPIDINGPKAVYTVKGNGVQEDIVYAHAPSENISLRYKLELPETLQARMIPNGSLGIYSASPYLFGNISYGSAADQQKVQAARLNGAKNNLVFVLPAPQLITGNGIVVASTTRHLSLSLSADIVTLNASGLGNLRGPISIDPSVVVTAASDFSNGGNDENDITFDTTNNQITEAGLTGGSLGSWTATTTFPSSTPNMPARYAPAAVAYNGYLYVLGGRASTSGGDCTTSSDFCNGVFYASMSSGSLGSWAQDTTATFPAGMPARYFFAAVAYNGYLYAMGGVANASSGDCTATGHNCNGVFYAPIASNGLVGAWSATTSFSSSSPTMPARGTFAAVAYNGYLYVVGGSSGATSGDCSGALYYCNGVFYAPFSADGTIGSWSATTTFPSSSPAMPARSGLSAVTYNGYIYVLGGVNVASGGDCLSANNDYCNGVFYAPINANGTIGSWSATTSFSSSSPTMPARMLFNAVAYNGYLYVMGGLAGSLAGDCGASNDACNGTFYAPINADGTIGSWTQTTTFPLSSPNMPARYGAGGAAYNGYFYIVAGQGEVATGDCSGSGQIFCNGAFSAPIEPAGTTGIYNSTTVFTSSTMPARAGAGAVAYNGYVYVLGGVSGASGGDCTATGDYCNGVFYAAVSSNGTISSWTSTTAFPSSSPVMPARSDFGAVVYNGYLYAVGGISGASSGDCTSTGNFCDGVFYTPINTNGTIGSWAATTTFPSSSPQMNAREDFGAMAYNGYLYAVGGESGNSGAGSDCNASGDFCDGTFYTPINTNGTIGSWAATTTFPTSSPDMPRRAQFGSMIYNGYMYVMGGYSYLGGGDCASGTGNVCIGVFYAPVNSNGTIGSWNSTTSFPASSPYMPARGDFGAVANNGYIYVLGGYSYASAGGDCSATGDMCNGVFYAPINANGTIGSWQTNTSFTATTMPARNLESVVAYNGYMYVFGGKEDVGGGDCTATSDYCNGVFYAPMNNGGPGTLSSNFTTTNSLIHTIDLAGTVAYNGYIYEVGGWDGNTNYPTNNVEYALICTGGNSGTGGCGSSPGTVGTWTYTTNALLNNSSTYNDTYAAFGITSVAYNGYLYALGGETDNAGYSTQEPTAVVEYALICTGSNSGVGGCNSTAGNTGTWAATTSLPAITADSTSAVYGGYVYDIAGCNHQYCNQGSAYVNYALICTGSNSGVGGCGSTAGTVGTWTQQSSNNLLQVTGFASSVVYNGYIYEIGGANPASGVAYSSVDYALICNGSNNGVGGCGSSAGPTGTWTATNGLLTGTEFAGAVAYDGFLYEIGGYNSTNSKLDYFAPINNNGTLGNWEETTSLPTASTQASAVVYDGFVYDVGEGNSGTTPSSTVVSAGLDSVPRLGYYSSLVDLSGLAGDDPAPAEILTNGGDCSSGACTSSLTNPENGSLSGGPGGIYLNYQLASNGCTKFNSLTTMPTLASGQSFVGTKQPLVFTTDGCSNATAVGRYMRLTYLLDDTQTATFPDATGNHTSISDFTVYYHAASTNRLRGGETFSNANLQALDTPP